MIVPGYPHHIVQRGNNRQGIFFEDEDRLQYLGLLKTYRDKWVCEVLARCLMDNQIHLLIVPKEETSLSKLMQGVSLCWTRGVNQKYRRTGGLWNVGTLHAWLKGIPMYELFVDTSNVIL